MNIKINHQIAQSIVEAIHEVCECPINFIDRRGIIIASTDSSRLNTFHEAGFQAIQNSMAVFVHKEGEYSGTKEGVNYPIFIEGTVVAVVGITGYPLEVSKFGFLATKISEVFIKEQYLSRLRDSKKQKMNYFIRAYIYNHVEDETYIEELRKEFQMSYENYAIVCIRVHQRYNLENIGLVERKIETLFQQLEITCYTYLYPNEFIGLLKEEKTEYAVRALIQLCAGLSSVLKVGIGLAEPFGGLWTSYEQARFALECIEDTEKNCQLFSELGIERVLRILEKHLDFNYVEFILRKLSTYDKDILMSYFTLNMKLKETAQENFIHVNTLQNKLNKIQEKNGLNPREFRDAVKLYIAILLERMKK